MIICVNMVLENALHFKNRREWRRWLSANYDKKDELWLVHYKKNSGIAALSAWKQARAT